MGKIGIEFRNKIFGKEAKMKSGTTWERKYLL